MPTWVKASCCGPDDAHHLRPDQVHRVSDDYYMVDGYRYRIPARDALPSQDGDYWIFYRDGDGRGAVDRLLLLRADEFLTTTSGPAEAASIRSREAREARGPFGARCRSTAAARSPPK